MCGHFAPKARPNKCTLCAVVAAKKERKNMYIMAAKSWVERGAFLSFFDPHLLIEINFWAVYFTVHTHFLICLIIHKVFSPSYLFCVEHVCECSIVFCEQDDRVLLLLQTNRKHLSGGEMRWKGGEYSKVAWQWKMEIASGVFQWFFTWADWF